MAINILYFLILIMFTILSWGFVDANALLPKIALLGPIIHFQTIYPTVWYTATVASLFGWYFWILRGVKKGLFISKHIWYLIIGTAMILVWSYPALSNDIFNYIATAKITFLYRENPYVIMPIEIPNDPSFGFLHAANKVALYGPIWITMTAIPYYLSMGNLLASIFTFKIYIILWYVLLCYLIWITSGKKTLALAFFSLNPLVTLSTVVDGHNDVVMMILALASFLFLKRRKFMLSLLFFLASIFIKGATLFLVPVFFWCLYMTWKKRSISWQQVWYISSMSMYVIFLMSPLREEIYAWYFIWPLTFLALVDKPTILHTASYGFSLGLMLRIVPFFYTRSWSGFTPIVKKAVTFVPPVLAMLFYAKKHHR